MRVRVLLNFVVLQTADRAIDFQHGKRNLVTATDAMFPNSAVQFVHAHVLARHVRLNELSIMDQERGLAFDQSPPPPVATRNLGDQIVQKSGGGRRHRAAK